MRGDDSLPVLGAAIILATSRMLLAMAGLVDTISIKSCTDSDSRAVEVDEGPADDEEGLAPDPEDAEVWVPSAGVFFGGALKRTMLVVDVSLEAVALGAEEACFLEWAGNLPSSEGGSGDDMMGRVFKAR